VPLTPQELTIACNDAFKVHTGGACDTKSDEDLKYLLKALFQLQASQLIQPWMKQAIQSFENEISRRNVQGVSKTLHDVEMAQSKTHHETVVGKLDNLKTAVDQLARARCVDRWILVAGWIAAIGAAVAAWFAIFPRH
jgi:hypothetical protein